MTKRRQLELRKLQCQKYSTRKNTDVKKLVDECATQNLVDRQTEYDRKDSRSIFLRVFSFSCCKRSGKEDEDDPTNNFKYKITYKNKKCEHCEATGEGEGNQIKQEALKKSASQDQFLNKEINSKCLKCNREITEQNMLSIDDLSSGANKSKIFLIFLKFLYFWVLVVSLVCRY